MNTRTFTAVLHKEDDIYVAECPEVGTVSQDYAIDEAVANLEEAMELCRGVSCPRGLKVSRNLI